MIRPSTPSISADWHLTVSNVSPEAQRTIEMIAKEYRANRAHVARCILNEAVKDVARVEMLVKQSGAQKRKRYAPVQKKYKKPEPVKTASRHDEICGELNGSVPAGGCRYPNCNCK